MSGLATFLPVAILAFVFVLSLVVVVHELGHYWAARMFGTRIDQFSIGFGRSLVHWRDRQGVEWRIAWIPLGGYVRFSGDENAASVPDQNDLAAMKAAIAEREGPGAEKAYFQFKPIWQRAVITAAGPIANFILAVALFAVLLGGFGELTLPARITSVQPGTPAAAAGFQAGDVVREADGRPIRDWVAFSQYIQMRARQPITFTVDRGSQTVSLTATPIAETIENRIAGRIEIGKLGVASPDRSEMVRIRYNPIEAVAMGAERTWDVLSTTVFYLGRIITGQAKPDQIGSILGIGNTAGHVAQAGAAGHTNAPDMLFGSFVALLGLAAVLSVSVGFMNLLPLPVLDGGHLLFYAYEAVARRPLPGQVQAVAYRLGLALLVGFMLFATWNDLQRLGVVKFLGGLFS